VHCHILRGCDPDTDLITLDPEHGHTDGITDHQGFAYAAGEDQHGFNLLGTDE